MSETIKMVCYKYKTLSNGESPLMVRICKDGKKKYQSLGISIKAEQWDFKSNLPKLKCPNRERILVLVNEKINEIQKAALDKRIAGKDFTAMNPKHRVLRVRLVFGYPLATRQNKKASKSND